MKIPPRMWFSCSSFWNSAMAMFMRICSDDVCVKECRAPKCRLPMPCFIRNTSRPRLPRFPPEYTAL